MAFSYLKEDNLSKKYAAAKDYTEGLTEPYPEFERIAGNKPSDDVDSRYSDVTDGTTASAVRKLGKRIVQQLPTGRVETDEDNNWLPIVAEFIYTNKILPYAVLDYDLIQKCWQAIERGATYGGQAIYTPFVNHNGEFTTDMSLPYWADIFVPAGSKSGYEHKYIFMRSWWQKEDIEALIAQEKELKKKSKERNEDYESDWDLKALETAKDMFSEKKSDEKDPAERDRDLETSGIEVVTGFQTGEGAIFYTFIPTGASQSKQRSTATDDDIVILRRKVNKDPRGKMPIDWYYNDTDGFNPLGRGLVELIGALQNLIDTDMQMYQWNRALMLNPPIVKSGSFSKKKIVYAPGAIIDVGSDPNANISPLKVDTSAVVNYPDIYGLQKSQLLNLVSSPDTSISAEVGNPGFGKTPTALNMQQQTVSVDDNYVRKNFEAMWENWSETAINLYFAERQGKEELQLDKKTADKLRALAKEGKFDIANLSVDNKIVIDYDTATPALKFRVDASTSKIKEDQNQSEVLMELLDKASQNPILSQIIPTEKYLAAWNKIVSNSAVEDPEDLTIDLEEFRKQQEEQQAQVAQQQVIDEQMALGDGAVENPAAPSEDEQIVAQLQRMGVPDEYAVQALEMLDKGYSPDEVIQAIQGVMQHVAA